MDSFLSKAELGSSDGNPGRFFFIYGTTELLVGLPIRAIRSKRIAATGATVSISVTHVHIGSPSVCPDLRVSVKDLDLEQSEGDSTISFF